MLRYRIFQFSLYIFLIEKLNFDFGIKHTLSKGRFRFLQRQQLPEIEKPKQNTRKQKIHALVDPLLQS